jgi:hypothetical protein
MTYLQPLIRVRKSGQDREVKMKTLIMIVAIASMLIAGTSAGAAQVPQRGKQPLYTITINVVARSTKAINYQHRNGSTTIGFQGTPLMPLARGEAKVESK